MSKMLRLLLIAVVACVMQTNLSGYVRIAGIAPDFMIATLVAITGFCGPYGGFCTGSVMAMFYDASVGYVLVINLVAYTFIGWAAPLIRAFLEKFLRKLRHKSYLVMLLIAFFLSLLREVLYIGYLFLIGAEQNLFTIVRLLLSSAYTSVMVFPCAWLVRWLMRWHPIKAQKNHDDLVQDAATETNR